MAQTASLQRENIFDFSKAFSTFSVDDIDSAKQFYSNTLGVDVAEEKEGGISLDLGGNKVFLYPKSDHSAATFTVLNIPVSDIELAVEELKGRGVQFESYGGDIATDDNGIFRGADRGEGPNIAWFKDPAGNVISVIEQD
jgi:catechol 2,3-dioxygenase-like lactoylglutathione lyase family enzyme